MTALDRDLSAPEIWQRSLERSRRRRVLAPKLRRQAARRRRASTTMAAAMLAGPAASVASAQGGGSDSVGAGIAADSPANRAIAQDVGYQGVLQLGSSGPAVAKVQRALDITATAAFDRRTDQAVRAFQGNAGLEADGIVGPRTWQVLFGGGSGGDTGPAANTGGSNLTTIPAEGGAQPGTSFAVRAVGDGERSELALDDLAPTQGSQNSGALVAIELRTPGDAEERSSTSSSGESAGSASRDRSNGSSEPSRASSRGPESATGSAPSSGSSNGSGSDRGTSGNENGNSGSAPSPPRSGEPPSRGNDGDNGSPGSSGSCGSRKIIDPLGGRGFLSSGYRTSARPSHAGADYAAPMGTPIRAAACGVVSFLQGSASTGGYGNFICVKHSSSFTTCYAHLSRFSNKRVGDFVHQGRIIGYVGSTGHSTGPHLHFETRTGNPYGRNDVNPLPYLSGREFGGTLVSVGGPDLVQPEQVSAAQAAAQPERRSEGAMAVGTGPTESAAPIEASDESAAPVAETSRSDASAPADEQVTEGQRASKDEAGEQPSRESASQTDPPATDEVGDGGADERASGGGDSAESAGEEASTGSLGGNGSTDPGGSGAGSSGAGAASDGATGSTGEAPAANAPLGAEAGTVCDGSAGSTGSAGTAQAAGSSAATCDSASEDVGADSEGSGSAE